ncbi:hypothetical protein KORDIASMS9_03858 [Kordia sp. SMS9]|uniref:DUF6438 domain-containing protein n=1 Tax=Kordia sp. SMS9 TaxID=2282170 RepID=UPI000E0D0A56|nr:DUF6438 domain-containing protein [Kordia sp. SMS9]AXG71601.1 hypothetical protein KORDIASMS9_03858 [Kordia sp. SMS9]
MKSIFSILLISLLLYNCTSEKKQNSLKSKIQGAWIEINVDSIHKKRSISPFKIPFGLNFQQDAVDFFKQFTASKKDSLRGKRSYSTFVGMVPYQLKADSLFIQHPLQQNLHVFQFTIDASKKDTLILQKNDQTRYTLIPLPTPEKDTLHFDQVVLSRSGCFGSCPIMNISIHRNGSVIFKGEKHTDVIGVYNTTLSPKLTNYLFKKLEAIQISKVSDNYMVGHTDDETISTTFLENGTIVKTIRDYGQAGTKEMLWAYLATLNLYKQLPLVETANLTEIPIPEFLYFDKDKKRLFLEKSEAFLLWLALQNATITPTNFKPTYIFSGGYYAKNLKRIESDGQLYKVYLKNGKIDTYDMGYNFIEKNFTEADFKKLQ